MVDDLLDPEVLALLSRMASEGGAALETLPVEEARTAAAEALKAVAGPAEPVSSIKDIDIPGLGGAIGIRVYSPGGDGLCPALVYFHGGGWVVCDLDTHDTVCRAIARQSGAVVIAVDYRLAPAQRFPAAVEDAYAATVWVAQNAVRLGVDAQRIAVGGDSAGGNLATVTALKCRDEGGPALALQLLVYPVTNLAAFDTSSYESFSVGYNLTRAEMEWFRDCYLPNAAERQHPHASPLLARDLHGLPPALVITAECDVLRDEGEAYAKRLEEAGVPVRCTRYRGMIHPFFSMPGALTRARDAIAEVAEAVRQVTPVSSSV